MRVDSRSGLGKTWNRKKLNLNISGLLLSLGGSDKDKILLIGSIINKTFTKI